MAQRRHSRRHRALIAVLIQAREQAGLSQRDVAVKMKRAINFAHLVESGERMVSAVEFPDYAKALGVDALELYGRVLTLERSGDPIPTRADARSKRYRKAK